MVIPFLVLMYTDFMKFIPEEEIVLAEILNKPKEFLITHPFIKLSAAQEKKFEKMRKELKSGVPLAYVIGYKWFFGNKFVVNKNVLIPRPETEQLVELALHSAKTINPKIILDIGTGPGTIIISIAKALHDSKANFTAADISTQALETAKKNQKALLKKTRIKFVKSDLLKSFGKLKNSANVLITANLPYLSKKELSEPSIKKEPKLALLGGKNSHNLIEKLIIQISRLNLKNSAILLEINYNQGKILQKIIKKHLPQADVKLHKDFSKYDRIIEIYLP